MNTSLTNSYFDLLKNAIESVTSYTLRIARDDEGELCYELVDRFGDVDGDPFYDLEDVEDYINNNEDIEEFLKSYKGR